MARLPTQDLLDRYYLKDRLPTIWCPGCGLGTATAAFVRGFDQTALDRDKTVLVNGIGCSGRTAAYLDFDVLKGTHGRAIAFATGIKLFRPELTVVVMAGDGDTLAIGGNHFIHAARRDIDLTVILFNNQIYGMTGGQVSPTTPLGAKGSTAPTGLTERSFDPCQLAAAAGASYVARATAYHSQLLTRVVRQALLHHGFALVEVIAQCPQQYGRWNKAGTAYDMLQWQKEHAVRVEKAAKMSPEALAGKIVIGEMVKG
ncbi:MAG: thiamine pyrophosphate-dependent enzyme [Anaerolineae bacterium]|nr:thiamine pyrophosphate-dependent enzyme [Anaerolineae bacterium]